MHNVVDVHPIHPLKDLPKKVLPDKELISIIAYSHQLANNGSKQFHDELCRIDHNKISFPPN